jgi:hypothetical protein
MEFVDELRQEIDLLPGTVVDVRDKRLVGVGHALDVAAEHVQHVHGSLRTPKEPDAEFVEEGDINRTGDDAAPFRKPPLDVVVCDILNEKVVPPEVQREPPLLSRARIRDRR